MCFGMQTSKEVSTTATPNPAVASAANQNLSFAQGLQNTGFTPYTGNQVANFSPLQNQTFGIASDMISGGGAYVPQAEGMINQYASAPASHVDPSTIASQMSPYMNQYVSQALAPQLEAQNQQFAAQNRGADASSTMAGAFGNDAQAAIGKANLTNQQDIARQGLIGQAYTSAFNTAIGAGAQDVSNSLNAQTTNANLKEQANARQLGGAQALEGLGQYGAGLTNFANTLGGQQTAQSQAGLNAAYNQWLMGQQYPFQTAQLLNQTIGAGSQAMPASTTQTTQQPNNSGLALAGNILGTVMGNSNLGSNIFGGGSSGSSGSSYGNGTGAMADGQAGWSNFGTGSTMYPMFV